MTVSHPANLYPIDFKRALAKWATIKSSLLTYDSLAASTDQLNSQSVSMAAIEITRAVPAIQAKAPYAAAWNQNIIALATYEIVKGTKHLAAAESLLQYMATPTPQAAMAKDEFLGPVVAGAALPSDPLVQSLNAALPDINRSELSRIRTGGRKVTTSPREPPCGPTSSPAESVTQLQTRSVAPPQGPRTRASNNWAWLVVPGVLLLAAGYFYPVFAIFVRSITQPRSQGLGTFSDFSWLFHSHTNVEVLIRTLVNAIEVSAICLALGYPYAYAMTIVSSRYRLLMIGVVLVPFWTSATVRNYAWLILLQNHGAVNYGLHKMGLPSVNILGTTTAVLIGECYVMLPFMILPLYTVMSGINRRLLDAAESLGANGRTSFFNVYLPLSLSGVAGGVLIVFLQALGFYLTPAILGSVGNSLMLPQLIVTQVDTLLDWGKGGALSLLLIGTVLVVLGLAALTGRRIGVSAAAGGELSLSTVDRAKAVPGRWVLKTFSWILGIAMVVPTLIVFPMALTNVSSFQFPPPGWSLQWYRSFFASHMWLSALSNSLVISIATAVFATVIGTAAALGVARGRLGRKVALPVLIAPMIVPTVITAVGVYLVALKFHLVSSFTGFIIVYTCLRNSVRADSGLRAAELL